MNKVYQSIQENVIDYFKDVDDKTFIAVVDTLAYHQPIGDNKSAGLLINKFLKDNDLLQDFVICREKEMPTKKQHPNTSRS